jgi:hypothetical protein
MKLSLSVLLAATLSVNAATAQQEMPDSSFKSMQPLVQKFYIGSATDGAIFSTATIQHSKLSAAGTPVVTDKMGTLRFSYFFNYGFTFNYNASRRIGIYSGIDVKNLGFIENVNGVTVKRRTYNVGIPLGLKIGNMTRKGFFIFLGGGVDIPVNYKEKAFVLRNQKTKFNEWFSERTPQVMPYVFAGVKIRKGISFKAQYYLNNFLNPDYVTAGIMPYAGYEVHPVLFTVGVVTRYSKKHDLVKKQITGLRTM